MANEVKIRVTADTDQAKKALTSAVDVMTSLKSAVSLATGTAGQLKQLNDQFFTMGKAGANIAQTEASFSSLITKIGTYPDLLERLRTASRGTIDDQVLMASTATLLAGAEDGLAKSLADATPQLLEIAKAANKLNPTLGDTAFLYESISTGIKRGSPMILDNLGITIKIGEANEKYAKAIGKTVEQLTASEQKQALLNATLDAGNTLMEQAGGNADATADAIARMETAQKNADDQRKRAMAPYAAFVAEIDAEASAVTASTNTGWLRYIPVLNAAQQAISHGYGVIKTLTENVEESTVAVNNIEGGYVGFASTLNNTATPAIDGASKALANQKSMMDQVNASLSEVTKQQLFNIASANLNAEAALGLARDMGILNEESYGAYTIMQDLQAQYEAGKITAAEYASQVAALGAAIDTLHDKSVTITTNFVNNGGSYHSGDVIPEGQGTGGGPGEATGYASGGSFIIPPGYNENYPVGNNRYASSGETVTINAPMTINQQPGQSAEQLARVIGRYLGREYNSARRSGRGM